MPQHSTPTRTCLGCFKPFTSKRVTGRYCSDRCRQRVKRNIDRIDAKLFPRRQFGPQGYTYRPRTLAAAELALERGVPLDSLILEEDERAALEASWRGFPFEERWDAAKRLVELRYRGLLAHEHHFSADADERDVELGDVALEVMASLEEAHGQVIDSLPTRGRRKRRLASGALIGGWTPATESWVVMLGLGYLRHVLSERKDAVKDDSHESALAGDAPVVSEGDGETFRSLSPGSAFDLLFANAPDVYFAGEPEKEHSYERPNPRHARGSGFNHYHRALRAPSTSDYARRQRRDQVNEILERLARLEKTAADTNARITETCERLRERFPNDEEIAAAVERFLDGALSR